MTTTISFGLTGSHGLVGCGGGPVERLQDQKSTR
jgi:hypothetical protein